MFQVDFHQNSCRVKKWCQFAVGLPSQDEKWHPMTTVSFTFKQLISCTTRMWASAQRDGRPAEYRWRPLFNAAKFGSRPLLECRAVCRLLRKNPQFKIKRWHKLIIRHHWIHGKQELIRRWDSERELFLQHRTCRGQRLHPLNEFVISTKHLRYLPTHQTEF